MKQLGWGLWLPMGAYTFVRDKQTSAEEVEAILTGDKTETKWVGVLAAFLYVFGCRVTEALRLKKEDFRIEGNLLQVQIPLLKKGGRNHIGPYESTHFLHVSLDTPFVKDTILPYVVSLTDESERLFPYSRVYAWMKLKELDPLLSPHVFRHDRLTKMAMQNASGAVLQDWAGWSDLRPAAKYLVRTGQIAKQFADKVN